jgi:AraC family transcriptional regulator
MAGQTDFLGTVVRRRAIGGIRLTETVLAPHSRTPRHFHEKGLLGWSLKGGYTNVYNRGQHQVESSRLMYCPAGETHSTTTEFGAISFAMELEPRWIERFEGGLLPPIPSIFELGSLNALTARLYREFNETDPSSGLAIEGMALEMIAAIMRFGDIPRGAAPHWLRGVREIIQQRFRESITVTGMAREVDIHPVYLATTFRRKYGHSIAAYVRELRIQYAIRQLSESADSLATIAQAAGFADQSHFCRIFKRVTGMTPATYRIGSGKRSDL